MWPWEHLAVGYLLYSLGVRVVRRRPPTERGVLVVAFATQLPDLVDKPLSWGLHAFPTGYALGHAVFVAVPVGLFAVVVATRLGEPAVGVALLVGYWSHLVGDVLNPLRSGGPPSPGRVLWPLVEGQPYVTDLGLWRAVVYLSRFPRELLAADPTSAVVLYLLLPAVAGVLWVADGAPGLVLTVRIARRLRQ